MFAPIHIQKAIACFLDRKTAAIDNLIAKIIDDPEFGDVVRDWMLQKVYKRLTEATPVS
ncbi:hypothetical protein [Synechococcus sp. PCC 7336]|uniref:hypothetical protein n=1 Tax=Synechococcus sp. PCC 7336 TaxID=195250 RepID=UPI0003486F84|nr:hypothetical protein [Synechococcus sp. PCC 7336]